ncbi:hypothetical protein GCM10009117_22810 [Gangjinia marincola]|uniref:Thioredoxin domain-containing protein n=2 Tax=Gangjinia marincola TaxID=578463 RepID=A0ABP3XXR4_9FLAO
MGCVSNEQTDLKAQALLETAKDEIPIVNYEELAPLLKQQNDTTYVINFWATWCKPCVQELPYFETIGSRYPGKVKVILVSLDMPQLLEKQVIPFVKKNKIQSDVLLLDDPDANGWINKVSTRWSGSIPATLIYRGTDRTFYEQSFTYKELNEELTKFL